MKELENSMELEEPKKEETYERRMVSVCAWEISRNLKQ